MHHATLASPPNETISTILLSAKKIQINRLRKHHAPVKTVPF